MLSVCSLQFCFQYSVFLLTYVSVERYVAVVHRNGQWRTLRAGGKRRTVMPAVLAVLPGGTALFDMCNWTAVPVSHALTVCASLRTGGHAIFWIRILVYFIVPTCILVYCNLAIVKFVRAHINNNPCANARSLRPAQSLPVVAFASFICCWLPWLLSSVFFSFVFGCHVTTVLNVCTAVGHVYCTTTAVAYLFAARKRWKRAGSLNSQNTYTDHPRSP